MISKIEEMKKRRRVEKAKKEGKSTNPENLASEVEKIIPPGYEVDVGV